MWHSQICFKRPMKQVLNQFPYQILREEITMSRDYKWEAKKAMWRGVEVVFTGAEYLWGWFFPDPQIIDGAGAIKKLPAKIKADGKKKVLIVTDKGLKIGRAHV